MTSLCADIFDMTSSVFDDTCVYLWMMFFDQICMSIDNSRTVAGQCIFHILTFYLFESQILYIISTIFGVDTLSSVFLYRLT